MKPHAFLICTVFLLAYLFSPVQAIDIEVLSTDGSGQVGGFYGLYSPTVDMPPGGYSATLPPDNDPSFQNYFMGRSTLGPLSTADSTPERRAFFMFDMAGVLASIPAGHTISGVTIDLTLTAGGSAALANFSGGVETVEFTGTPFSEVEILDPVGTSTPTDSIWSTFGTSTPYGGFEITGTPPPGAAPPSADGLMTLAPDTYTIDLPGALPDLGTAIGAGGMFIVTARLASFDPDVIGTSAPPATDPYEYVFGITDVASPSGSTVAPPVLTISTIPEPSAFLLIALGGMTAAHIRRVRRQAGTKQ